jgi:hypothetical protein
MRPPGPKERNPEYQPGWSLADGVEDLIVTAVRREADTADLF